MKIYTKTGDKGETSLLGGERVSKTNMRIEAYGTVDELNAWVGVLRDSIQNQRIMEQLIFIQDKLFTAGSRLATHPDNKRNFSLPDLKDEHIEMLEKAMDEMDAELPPMKNFVLPGGHPAVSNAHVCRTVCRRAERRVIDLQQNEKVDEIIGRYLNRLSDYFFVLSRFLALENNAAETPWKPAK